MPIDRRYFEYTPDAVLIVSPDEDIEAANSRAEHLFGYAPDELLGLPAMVVIPYRFAAHAGEGAPRARVRLLGRRRDGSPLPVDVAFAPVSTEESSSVFVVVRDASETSQLEAKLHASEAFRAAILETALDCVICMDHEGRIVEFNRAAEKTFGYSRAAVMGQPMAEVVIPPSLRDAHRAGLARFLATGHQTVLGCRVEVTAMRADGTEFPVELAITLTPKSDPPLFVGYLRDITERKTAEEERRRLEEQFQRQQKLESLEVLAGGIAHDFNNLLTSILGYGDLALLELSPDALARPMIEEAMKGARQAAVLTQQMLAYSGRGRFVVVPLDLSKLTGDTVQLLQVSISKKCVLRCELANDLPAIEADVGQIRQMVMNLVLNAAEAIGSPGGLIVLSTGVVHCDRSCFVGTYADEDLPEGTYVYLDVTDNGIGMSKETRAKIFEPFFSTKFAGRGLGLAAVLGIVRGHRGAILCDSEPDRGTTFRVLLPARPLPAGDRL